MLSLQPQAVKLRFHCPIIDSELFSKGFRLSSGVTLSAKTSPAGADGAVMLFAILLIYLP
jgi:hypothetical protein